MDDPFGTAALRAAVLDAWAASPTRFREDANAEEDLRLGGYADTWFVELAQNAADAAGAGGRLRVRIAASPGAEGSERGIADLGEVDGGRATGPELRVANTGAPLTGAGVAALASLRASAKRDDEGSVGRFGVGFAAVLALSDAPRVASASGAVAFSAARTAAEVAALPGPAAELARRDAPPILRLVWPSAERPPEGYATEVRLPLRPGLDAAALLAHARAAAPDLLLALPGLDEIAVDGEVVARTESDGVVTVGSRRWLVARRTGTLAAADVAAEQRGRQEWAVTWALPLNGALGDDVAHAPTATAEALALPARLIATLPLEPDRRRVRLGPATDAVLDGAAAAYVDLVRSVAPGERLALVPAPGFPRSPLDGQLRARIVDGLRAATWLPAAGGGELAPGRAEWLDVPDLGADLPALLAEAGFDHLAAPPYVPVALTELGARRVTAAELVERLFGVERPPAWWRAVYAELAELADVVPGLVDDLRALPVPLADGRCAAGPATVLLPEAAHAAGPVGRTLGGPDTDGAGRAFAQGGPDADRADGGGWGVDGVGLGTGVEAALAGLALPGLHIAHPAAVHPLLARLGATPADPAALLGHPALLAAVERSVDDAEAGLDAAALAEAVLALVEAGALATEALAALALPDADGVPARADELMLPDAALRPLLADDAPLAVLDPRWAARFPREVLTAVGALDGFALVVDDEPVGPDHDLDDEDRWWDGLDEPPSRMVAVRDLDLVADDAWPAALALLGADRATREAATTGYTAWWLARHARFGGRRPGHWRLPSATALGTLYEPVPAPPFMITGAAPSPAMITGSAQKAARTDRECSELVITAGGAGLDEALLAAIGVRRDLHIADARSADDLLARLADPARHPSAALVATAHIALADAVTDGRVQAEDLHLPEHVRAMDGSVVHVDFAAVLDAPWPAAVLPAAELVIGGDPVALGELLDLPLATEIVAGDVEGDGEPVSWAELGEVVVACHTLGVDVPPGGLCRHRELWVELHRPTHDRHRVPVWRDAAGAYHAEDPVRALLAVLAE